MGVGEGWNTPLPYLFGGLAAMFFLISMSLLFLVCSYVRRTNRLERDVEAAAVERREGSERVGGILNRKLEKKFAVIMPGDENPTCLATPMCYEVFHSVEDEKKSSLGDEIVVGKDMSSAETTSSNPQISAIESRDVD